jgi:cobalt-zinc-cadmium efflux system protein
MSGHHHHDAVTAGNKLKISLILSITILVAEVIGGLVSNSLALLSDAGHVFADVVALGLSWYAVRQSMRPSNSKMTFGYHRIGVVVAIVNATTIFIIAAVILFEAYNRFQAPPDVNSELMTIIAFVGLSANVFVTLWLRAEQKTNINIRSVFWHAFGDALASLGVIIGGIIITFTNKFFVDPLISVLISLIILYAAWSILREGVKVILEATPSDVDVESLIKAVKLVPGVKDFHDVHVWSISPEIRAMNGHVLIEDISTSKGEEIRGNIEQVLKDQFHIEHTTLQMECQVCSSTDTFCNLNTESGAPGTCPIDVDEKIKPAVKK